MDYVENIEQKPTRSDELNHIGTEFYAKGMLRPAYFHFMAALESDPRNSRAWMNIGATLAHGGHDPAAEIAARLGLALDPFNVMFKNNIGNALMGQRKYSEAVRYFDEALQAISTDAGLYHNQGLALYMFGDFSQAEAYLRQAVELRPDVPAIQNDLALAMLCQGKIQPALEIYEVRWKTLYQSKIWGLGVPEWQGEDLQGKKILIHHEQGFGDSIMLGRFIADVVALGAEVTISVPPELMRLFGYLNYGGPSLRIIDWESDDVKAEYDYHSPMMNVMRWLGIASKGEISSEPYITLPEEYEVNFKLPPAKVKIGLCWASGDHGPHLSKRRRYIPLEKLFPLALLPGVRLISLQKGENEKDIEHSGAHSFVFNPMAKVQDFYDTAHLISQLDLVITVDSAVAHLAGALGKPVIMFSPSPRCWRWWNIKFNGLPWYEDMVIVQQAEDGSWDEAIVEAVEEASMFVRYANA